MKIKAISCIPWTYLSILIFSISFIMACEAHIKYKPPAKLDYKSNSMEFDKSKNELWKIIIPVLAKNFFVINNLDKDSGLINVSYSGDPQKYIDCGFIESHVDTLNGKRDYYFPASIAHKNYQVMPAGIATEGLLYIDRKMDLEGRMNLILEEVTPNKTLVTANTKYIVTKSLNISNYNRLLNTLSDRISFNTNQGAYFPGKDTDNSTYCQANGRFEQDILSLIKNSIELKK